MDLQDHTAPVDFDADYAPRPKASQLTAAAKRARATLEDDVPIAPRRTASRQQLVLAAAAGLAIAAFVVMSIPPHAQW